MNASAYLKSQGWRGLGFSLDQSDRGIAKPLLVSHKKDLAGLGTKQTDAGSQWWLNAFNSSLNNVGGTENNTIVVSQALAKQPALYQNFVKAEVLQSTIDLSPIANDDETDNKSESGDCSVSGETHALPLRNSVLTKDIDIGDVNFPKGGKRKKRQYKEPERDDLQAGGSKEKKGRKRGQMVIGGIEQRRDKTSGKRKYGESADIRYPVGIEDSTEKSVQTAKPVWLSPKMEKNKKKRNSSTHNNIHRRFASDPNLTTHRLHALKTQNKQK